LNTFFIGIDFSMAKPAATLVCPDKSLHFFAWPEKLTNVAKDRFNFLPTSEIIVKSREIGSVPSDLPNSLHVYTHIVRATSLAHEIVDDLNGAICSWLFNNGGIDQEHVVYAASEGLSFNSKGKSTLDLATYKGIFLSVLVEMLRSSLASLYTYAPMTMKSVAGASKTAGSKDAMVQAFIADLPEGVSAFRDALASGNMKKKGGES